MDVHESGGSGFQEVPSPPPRKKGTLSSAGRQEAAKVTQDASSSKQMSGSALFFNRVRSAVNATTDRIVTWSKNLKSPIHKVAERTAHAAAKAAALQLEPTIREARPLPMNANQTRAVEEIRARASEESSQASQELTARLKEAGYSDEDIALIRMAFRRSEVTINITPEALVNMVTEGSLKYKTLFEDMYSKGANNPEAQMESEQALFPEYQWKKKHDVNEHPKYGTVSPIPFHAGGAAWYGAVALVLHEDANVTNATMTSYDTLNEKNQVAGTPDAMDHVLLERINRTKDALKDYGNGVKGDVREELDLILQYAKRAFAQPKMTENQTENPTSPTIANDAATDYTQSRLYGPINKYYEAQVHTTNLELNSQNVRALRIDFDKVKDNMKQLEPVIEFCVNNKIPIVWGCEDNRYFIDPRVPPQSSPETDTSDYYAQLKQAGASVGSTNEEKQAISDNFARLIAAGKSFTEIYDQMPQAFKDNLRGKP